MSYLKQVKDYLIECQKDGLSAEQSIPDLQTYLLALSRQKRDQKLYAAALQPSVIQKLVADHFPNPLSQG
jgi:hypothetical protein